MDRALGQRSFPRSVERQNSRDVKLGHCGLQKDVEFTVTETNLRRGRVLPGRTLRVL